MNFRVTIKKLHFSIGFFESLFCPLFVPPKKCQLSAKLWGRCLAQRWASVQADSLIQLNFEENCTWNKTSTSSFILVHNAFLCMKRAAQNTNSFLSLWRRFSIRIALLWMERDYMAQPKQCSKLVANLGVKLWLSCAYGSSVSCPSPVLFLSHPGVFLVYERQMEMLVLNDPLCNPLKCKI